MGIKTRVTGIDLLKVLSMFFIVALHILGHGGALEKVVYSSHIEYIEVWSLEIMALCGVDCFALASGFLSYQDKYDVAKSFSKYIRYWIPVVFYCLLFSILGGLVDHRISGLQLAKCFLPVTSYQYWYFSCFTGLFFCIPFINAIVHKLENNQLICIMGVSFILFSVYATPARILWNAFSIQDGYSFLWLTCLYFYGAVVKKLGLYNMFPRKKLLLAAVICFLITLIWKCGLHYLGLQADYALLEKGSDLLLFYISPTIVGLAFILFLLSCKIETRSTPINIFISKMAGLTFGVYLINDNPIIREKVFKGNFEFIIRNNCIMTWLYTLAAIVSIYLLCLFIELIRKYLFKLLSIDDMIMYTSKRINNLMDSVLRRLGL